MTIWSDEIQELCRLVAYEKIAAHLVDQFHTQAVRFFLEGFFYGERTELTERLKQLGESTASGTEPEAILTSSFLIGSYAPLSQALFESYAPSFSLPGTGEHKGGKVDVRDATVVARRLSCVIY